MSDDIPEQDQETNEGMPTIGRQFIDFLSTNRSYILDYQKMIYEIQDIEEYVETHFSYENMITLSNYLNSALLNTFGFNLDKSTSSILFNIGMREFRRNNIFGKSIAVVGYLKDGSNFNSEYTYFYSIVDDTYRLDFEKEIYLVSSPLLDALSVIFDMVLTGNNDLAEYLDYIIETKELPEDLTDYISISISKDEIRNIITSKILSENDSETLEWYKNQRGNNILH